MKKLHLLGVLVIIAVMLVVPPFLKSYGIYLFSYWIVFIIATMGLNLTIGYAGQKSRWAFRHCACRRSTSRLPRSASTPRSGS